jgi:hypothetical protein
VTSSEPARDSGARLDNGLTAQRYTPISDIAPETARHLLTALRRARIAAYLDEAPQAGNRRRLFVDAEERADARTVVAAAIRALGAGPSTDPALPQRAALDSGLDLTGGMDGMDTDAEFEALVAGWHVDTVAAIREAERDLTREDAEWRARLQPAVPPEPVWLEDEHYVPPPPPPLPRFAAPTVVAMTILAMSILLLGLGGELGLASNFTVLLGVGGVLVAAGILVSRLRPEHDSDEDGSAV